MMLLVGMNSNEIQMFLAKTFHRKYHLSDINDFYNIIYVDIDLDI